MNLIKKLERYLALDPNDKSNWYYKPNNYKKGLCNNCGSKLYKKGKSWTTCEYHYLKKKYTSTRNKITQANDGNITDSNKYLKGIKCTFSWPQFVKWCVENPDYKKMKFPTLVRINKKRNFSLKNIIWVDGNNFL